MISATRMQELLAQHRDHFGSTSSEASSIQQLIRTVALESAAAEREACAKTCEDIAFYAQSDKTMPGYCAKKIRARGRQ